MALDETSVSKTSVDSHAGQNVFTKIPKQGLRKPGQLSQEQLEDFFDKGFVVLHNFIDHKILDDVREAISKEVDELAEKLFAARKIRNKHEDKGLDVRLKYLEDEYPGISVLLHKSDYLSPAMQKLWGYEKLLNVVEQLIGPEISSCPVWNLRPKVPRNEQLTVPWHQDNAYFEPNAANALLPTAWIPFVNATKQNGCMQMVPKGQHKGITATHTCCAGPTWYVDLADDVMRNELNVDPRDAVTCEIPYGGLLLFSNCIPHRSLENFSDSIRWSADLRWQKTTDHEFYAYGNTVVMRTAKDSKLEIDWTPVTDAKEGRNKQQDKALGNDYDEFEPIISGPWMKRWEIVHHNQHTAQHQKSQRIRKRAGERIRLSQPATWRGVCDHWARLTVHVTCGRYHVMQCTGVDDHAKKQAKVLCRLRICMNFSSLFSNYCPVDYGMGCQTHDECSTKRRKISR